ncbi:hypothetical protein M413DRAFT_28997 [Hebeloma cylindrosporum]|uniref:Aminoglycoside phosphotransferase domain-containing protein n=1 Tax=Hebeloma cylindrosporum TaxID=76867 RepID=A0A0C3C894_HEBCY|nr:hypothetical protein M413DRAFT_28997 [Hebeloma cylindrosporum h7]
MTFDILTYLRELTAIKEWEIKDLAGGAANFTVRARPLSSASLDVNGAAKLDIELFNSYSSVVIKQAPDYLAKSPGFPFSPYRQVIEAQALQWFLISGNGLHTTLAQNPCIRVPQMLHHDRSSSILIQSDLGAVPNLYNILTDPTTSVSIAADLGHVIGQFLVDMHGCTPVTQSDIEKFQNADAERVMEATIAQAIIFMRDAGVTDFRSLGQLALDHWISRKKTAFAQGDLWFGTLLVEINKTRNNDRDSVVVGICDWEFAGPNDSAADLAQLGCYLHLLSSSPLKTSHMDEVIVTFSKNLYEAYFACSKTRLDSGFWNSLFIMHGWEMVNAAGWSARQDMWCACKGHGVRCSHIKEMIHVGAEFLRIALSTAEGKPEGFAQAHNANGTEWSRYFPLDIYN